METRANYVLIGLLTVLVVIAALLFGLWLSKSSSNQKFSEYQVIFNESVNGLTVGSSVQFSGIKIGEVTRLALDSKDPRRVVAEIRVNQNVPVRQETHASLAVIGITGVAVIQLSGGSPNSALLTSPNDSLPTIIADPSPLNRLFTNSQDVMVNVNETVTRLNQLLSDDNINRITRTFDHLDKATAVLSDQREDIRGLVQQLSQAVAHANELMVKADTLVGNTNLLVDNQGRDALVSAKNALASLEKSANTINSLLGENRGAVTGGLQGLDDLAPAIRDLRESAASLRGITRKIDDDPSGFLLGGDRSKEFKP